MYGSPVSKDLNLPVQPPMTSSGLLRYRSAPSTLLGEVCEDFLQPGPRAGSPDPCADNVFSRFLADHQIRDKPPAPAPHAPAAAHFPDTAAMASQHQHHQQQQMMFHSQQQQQQMAAVESGLYRTVSSGMEAPTAAVAGASSLIRQSSSPAGFLKHLNMDNGAEREPRQLHLLGEQAAAAVLRLKAPGRHHLHHHRHHLGFGIVDGGRTISGLEWRLQNNVSF